MGSKENTNVTPPMLDFKKLREFIINNLTTDTGGFTLAGKKDEYINATYFGVVSLYLLGGIDDVSEKIKTWIDYSYDENTHGFREWLGTNVSLRATLWGLLITNFSNITPKEFDLNATIEFINNSIPELHSLDIITSSLLLRVLSLLRKKLQNSLLTRLIPAIERHIIKFFDPQEGLFLDSRIDASPIFQTYLALTAISYNTSIIDDTMARNLAMAILDKQHSTSKEDDPLLGGFGFNPHQPTVFETGLSVSILLWLNKTKNLGEDIISLLGNRALWYNITLFVNRSQTELGGIRENPKSRLIDILHAFGAINVYLALRRLNKLYTIETRMLLDSQQTHEYQIPVDYNGTIKVETSLKFLEKSLPRFHARFRIIDTYRNKTDEGTPIFLDGKYMVNLSNILDLDFGRYLLCLTFYKNACLNTLSMDTKLEFRVGYMIAVEMNKTRLIPGNNIMISVNVTFYNMTIVKNSTLFAVIQHKAEGTLLREAFYLNGSTINISYSIPTNASLGRYEITLYVNDSHGFNHTFTKTSFTVNDDVIFSIRGNRSSYYIGETIEVLLHNVTYNRSGDKISVSANLSTTLVYIGEKASAKGNCSWIIYPDYVDIKLSLRIPPIIPRDPNITVKVHIMWDETPAGNRTITLFNASLQLQQLSISDLTIIDASTNQTLDVSEVYIGQNYLFKFRLIHSARVKINHQGTLVSCFIKNATLNVSIDDTSRNMSWTIGKTEYNRTGDTYISKIYIDPNIPAGTHNLTVRIYIIYNESWINITTKLTVTGTPIITDARFPDTVYAYHRYNASFHLMCNETHKLLANVSLVTEVTFIHKKAKTENKTIHVPVSVLNNTYAISFNVEESEMMLLKIYRSSDNLTIIYVLLTVVEKPKQIFSFEAWKTIPPVTIALAYTCYIFIRWRFSKKISRRFLVEKAKRFA